LFCKHTCFSFLSTAVVIVFHPSYATVRVGDGRPLRGAHAADDASFVFVRLERVLLLTYTDLIHAFSLSYLLVLVTYSARTHNFDPTLTNNPCFSLLRCALRDSCSFYTYHTVHFCMLTGMVTHMRFLRFLPWFPSTVCVSMMASPSWFGPAYFFVRPYCFVWGLVAFLHANTLAFSRVFLYFYWSPTCACFHVRTYEHTTSLPPFAV